LTTLRRQTSAPPLPYTTLFRSIADLGADPRCREYQPYWAARAELLARAGANADARQAYDVAIGLEKDEAVRRFLQARRATLQDRSEEHTSELQSRENLVCRLLL